MDAVGAHQNVGGDAVAVLEPRLDAVAVICQADKSVSDVQAFRGQGACQGEQQVGAMALVVGKAEGVLDRLAERRAQQCPAVLPTTLMNGFRPNGGPRQRVGEAEAVQNACGIGADLNAGSRFGQRMRLLVHVRVETRAEQGQCCG